MSRTFCMLLVASMPSSVFALISWKVRAPPRSFPCHFRCQAALGRCLQRMEHAEHPILWQPTLCPDTKRSH